MRITFSGKVTAQKLIEKKVPVPDADPEIYEGLELTVDANAKPLSDLSGADAKSKVRLLVDFADADRFPLGSTVNVTFELLQQEAFAGDDEDGTEATLSSPGGRT